MHREIYASDSLVKLAKDLGYDYDPDAMINDVNQYALANIQKWFREENTIHVYVFWDTVSYDVKVFHPDWSPEECFYLDMFNEYEEALEEGLRKACMMLKKKKDVSKVLD